MPDDPVLDAAGRIKKLQFSENFGLDLGKQVFQRYQWRVANSVKKFGWSRLQDCHTLCHAVFQARHLDVKIYTSRGSNQYSLESPGLYSRGRRTAVIPVRPYHRVRVRPVVLWSIRPCRLWPAPWQPSFPPYADHAPGVRNYNWAFWPCVPFVFGRRIWAHMRQVAIQVSISEATRNHGNVAAQFQPANPAGPRLRRNQATATRSKTRV